MRFTLFKFFILQICGSIASNCCAVKGKKKNSSSLTVATHANQFLHILVIVFPFGFFLLDLRFFIAYNLSECGTVRFQTEFFEGRLN